MKTKLSNEQKSEVIKNRILASPILSSLGYLFKNTSSERSELLPEVYVFELENSKIKLRVKISFIPAPPRNVFTVSIVKSEHELIFVDEYLERYESFKGKSPFNLHNYSGEFEERINKFLTYLEGVFSKELRDVLEGKKWMEIPFDRDDYKRKR